MQRGFGLLFDTKGPLFRVFYRRGRPIPPYRAPPDPAGSAPNTTTPYRNDSILALQTLLGVLQVRRGHQRTGVESRPPNWRRKDMTGVEDRVTVKAKGMGCGSRSRDTGSRPQRKTT